MSVVLRVVTLEEKPKLLLVQPFQYFSVSTSHTGSNAFSIGDLTGVFLQYKSRLEDWCITNELVPHTSWKLAIKIIVTLVSENRCIESRTVFFFLTNTLKIINPTNFERSLCLISEPQKNSRPLLKTQEVQQDKIWKTTEIEETSIKKFNCLELMLNVAFHEIGLVVGPEIRS